MVAVAFSALYGAVQLSLCLVLYIICTVTLPDGLMLGRAYGGGGASPVDLWGDLVCCIDGRLAAVV